MVFFKTDRSLGLTPVVLSHAGYLMQAWEKDADVRRKNPKPVSGPFYSDFLYGWMAQVPAPPQDSPHPKAHLTGGCET